MKFPYNMHGEIDGDPKDAWCNMNREQILEDIRVGMQMFGQTTYTPSDLVLPDNIRALLFPSMPLASSNVREVNAQECADRAVQRQWGHLPKAVR